MTDSDRSVSRSELRKFANQEPTEAAHQLATAQEIMEAMVKYMTGILPGQTKGYDHTERSLLCARVGEWKRNFDA